jgi:hypothetical protein
MVIGVGMVGVGITGEALTPTTEDAELWSRIGLTGLVIMSLYESVFATKERHARFTGLDFFAARFLLIECWLARLCKLREFLSVTILVWFVSTPIFATPFSAQTVIDTDHSVENARLICDEFGRCWQRQSAPYISRHPYSGYGYGYRPLTKWEQKGFCPPGQRKKGNLLKALAADMAALSTIRVS